MRTARATGTLTNRSGASASFRTRMVVQILTPDELLSGPALYGSWSATTPLIAVNASQAGIVVPDFPFEIAYQWKALALVQIGSVSPVANDNLRVTAWSSLFTETTAPIMAVDWVSTTGPGISGLAELDVEGSFNIGLGQEASTNWWPWLLVGGAVLLLPPLLKRARRR